MQETLADVLSEYVDRAHYSSGKLAKMTGLSRKSINNWLDGTVSKPQQWQVLTRLAAVLHLTELETNRLLLSAHHPTIADLRQNITTADDHALLAPWPPSTAVPFQAIPDLPYFVGRNDVLSELAEVLQHGAFVNVCNVWGMGGVGKTAVAARLAYQLRPAFPDGVLWANLATSDTMTILSLFAQTFGEDVSQLTDVNSRSTYVRGILANKRTLIILDDAQHNKQLELLLPPNTGKTAVIITTRHDLPAADGFKRAEIRPFNPESNDSLTLFINFLGQPRVHRNQSHLLEIANLLGHLPLAIAIAAARLAYTPYYSVPDFLNQIQQQEGRLDLLTRGEDRNVRLSFDISYQTLSPDLQAVFAALGTFGGESFSVEAVTAVTQQPTKTITTRLHQLARLSLLRHEANHRYSLHPLLRDYAREKISHKETWTRMVDYYITYVQTHEFDPPALDLETNNILAALQTAFTQNLAASIIEGIHIFYPFLEMRGLHDVAIRHLNQALQAARTNNDLSSEALILSHLAHLAHLQADYAQARAHAHYGLTLIQADNHSHIRTYLLYNLAAVNIEQGAYDQAESQLLEALHLVQQNGDNKKHSDILSLLGKAIAIGKSDYAQAENHFREAHTLAQKIGDQKRAGELLIRLGSAAYHRNQWQQAESFYRQGLQILQEMGDLRGQTTLLHNLGAVAQSQGHFAQAESYLQAGLAISEKINLKEMIVLTLSSLGETALEQEDLDAAQPYLQRAVTLAREIEHPANLSFALANLGAVALKQHDYQSADTYLQESLTLAQETGEGWDIFTALSWLGDLHLAREEFERAADVWTQARDLAQALGIDGLLGIALFHLARLKRAQDNLAEAVQLAQKSQVLLEQQGHHLHHKVSSWLDTLPQQTIK
ncbi:MAG: tetratricopeptide repeat protein [Ardenticatenaceae bacterium]|nr:tetratricopeptide repeat protein [Ardenticatenaceae bacterium]